MCQKADMATWLKTNLEKRLINKIMLFCHYRICFAIAMQFYICINNVNRNFMKYGFKKSLGFVYNLLNALINFFNFIK